MANLFVELLCRFDPGAGERRELTLQGQGGGSKGEGGVDGEGLMCLGHVRSVHGLHACPPAPFVVPLGLPCSKLSPRLGTSPAQSCHLCVPANPTCIPPGLLPLPSPHRRELSRQAASLRPVPHGRHIPVIATVCMWRYTRLYRHMHTGEKMHPFSDPRPTAPSPALQFFLSSRATTPTAWTTACASAWNTRYRCGTRPSTGLQAGPQARCCGAEPSRRCRTWRSAVQARASWHGLCMQSDRPVGGTSNMCPPPKSMP